MKKMILALAAATLFPLAATSALAQSAPLTPAEPAYGEPAQLPAGGIKKHANKKPAAKKAAAHKVAKKPAKKAGKGAAKKHGKKHH